MTRTADVVVAGLGAMGSAAARVLARRGLRVVGLDRFHPPHTLGSTHGRSRIIREAYFEHPAYVPLVQRAYTLWRELEAESQRALLRITGGLMIGPPGGPVLEGARLSARTHGLPHEELSPDEVRRRFPGFAPDAGTIGLLEPRAGVLFPEACIEAALDGAARAGAELRYDEEVTGWTADAGGDVRVTSTRESWSAAHLVLAAGAWLPRLRPALPLTVERNVMFWFSTGAPALFTPDACPIALWEFGGGRLFYTLPDFGDGFKAAIHHDGETTDPDRVRRDVTPEDEAEIRAPLGRFVPAAGAVREARVCLYTNTPDQHFLIDRDPDQPRVWIVSPCSGHGFKFASAIGEVVADLVTEGRSRFDLTPFAMSRLAPRA
jgi:sarcosine oxidase